MRLPLLLTILFFSGYAQAQFWSTASTGFPTTSTGISRFDIVDANIAWGVGYNGINPANNIQQFSKTNDAGLTWTDGVFSLGNVGLGIAQISALDFQTAYVAAYPRNAMQTGGVWKTTDGGTVWTKITSTQFTDGSSFPNTLQFYNNGDGVVMGDPIANVWEIYTTTDSGTTFTRVNSANIPVPLTNETGYLAQLENVGNSLWFTTSTGRIYHSTNRGLNWVVYQSPVSDFGGTAISADLTFSDATKGVMQTNAGLIYSTQDAGATWSQVTTSGTGNPFRDNIAYIPGTNSLVSVGSDPAFAGSSYSNDDGATWTNIDAIQHVDVAFFNDTNGYSGGFTQNSQTGGVFVSSSSVLSSGEFAFAKAIQLYPNPALNQLNITTEDSILQLELINLSGQLLKIFPSTRTVALDGIASGMYLLKITTDKGTQTLPFLKQ